MQCVSVVYTQSWVVLKTLTKLQLCCFMEVRKNSTCIKMSVISKCDPVRVDFFFFKPVFCCTVSYRDAFCLKSSIKSEAYLHLLEAKKHKGRNIKDDKVYLGNIFIFSPPKRRFMLVSTRPWMSIGEETQTKALISPHLEQSQGQRIKEGNECYCTPVR